MTLPCDPDRIEASLSQTVIVQNAGQRSILKIEAKLPGARFACALLFNDSHTKCQSKKTYS